jgi:hypothetical protein
VKIGRIVGAVLTWILLAGGAVFIIRTASDLATIGSCADGGAYVIAQHCPTSTYTLLPVGVAAIVLAFVVGSLLARGFGASPWASGPVLVLGGGAIAVIATVIAAPYAFPSLIVAAVLIVAVIALIRTRVKNGRARQYLFGDTTLDGTPWTGTPASSDRAFAAGFSVLGAVIGVALTLPWVL